MPPLRFPAAAWMDNSGAHRAWGMIGGWQGPRPGHSQSEERPPSPPGALSQDDGSIIRVTSSSCGARCGGWTQSNAGLVWESL